MIRFCTKCGATLYGQHSCADCNAFLTASKLQSITHGPICPKCGKPSRWYYGGERGETGPFIQCDECDYDGQEERLKERLKKGLKERFTRSKASATANKVWTTLPIEPTDAMVHAAIISRFGAPAAASMLKGKKIGSLDYETYATNMREWIKAALTTYIYPDSIISLLDAKEDEYCDFIANYIQPIPNGDSTDFKCTGIAPFRYSNDVGDQTRYFNSKWRIVKFDNGVYLYKMHHLYTISAVNTKGKIIVNKGEEIEITVRKEDY